MNLNQKKDLSNTCENDNLDGSTRFNFNNIDKEKLFRKVSARGRFNRMYKVNLFDKVSSLFKRIEKKGRSSTRMIRVLRYEEISRRII